ncbi:MAG: FtsX-like permease family protein [Proteobacteria bacterium]|uniref:FtsX-like permease family protein n=1 Tax=Candidatus Avisuccinivibrio stercorigallinarum TaxID=2840704 RepID=A0A9D9GT36_9GAMM|nr:FtsX-like permease family protein [Candidatus Avisuccinivibrio stercorigallinarum]
MAGILQTGSNEEGLIYLNFNDLKALTGYDRGFDVVECSIKGSEDSLRALSHKLESSFPEVKAQLVERVAKSEGRVLSRLQSLVWIVTLVVMVLTMVCVSTTMLAAAAERRQEIGLRKALGADKLSIIRQFMAESLMLGLVGGVLGTILGYGFALYVSQTVFASAVKPDLILALFTVAAAAAVTGISSYLPVYQASKTDPAVVLRGE